MTKEVNGRNIEDDFVQAITVLLKRHPGKKLSAVEVAREAGHSRTLISGMRCAYPAVRDLLEKSNAKRGPRAIVATLKARIARLERENALLLEQNLHLVAQKLRNM